MFRTPLQRAAGLAGLGVVVALLALIPRSDPPAGVAPPAAAGELVSARTPTHDGLPRGRVSFDAPEGAADPVAVAARPPQRVGSAEVDVGETHEGVRTIKGVVTDARGEPAVGAEVVLRVLANDVATALLDPAPGAEGVRAWTAIADADGAFVFTRASDSHLVVDARGRDGDKATVFVDAGWGLSLDLTLVLEATATVTVVSPELRGRSVRLQPVEARARGWSGAYDAPSPDSHDGAALSEAELIEEGDVGTPTDEGPQAHEAMMMAVLEALEAPLLEWDPDAPEASLVRLAEAAFGAVPPALVAGFDKEMQRELGLPEGTPRRALLEGAVAKVLEEEPALPRIVGLVATRFAKSPDRGLAALIEDKEFELEMRQAIEAEEQARREAERPEEGVSEEFEPAEVEVALAIDEPARPEPSMMDVERADFEAKFPDMAGLLEGRTWGAHEEAAGEVGAPLTVRAGYTYDVIVEVGAEHWVLNCGRVFVGAGEDLVVTCGPGEVVVTGRLVDGAGRPAPGQAFFQAWTERDFIGACETDVAPDGAFRCSVQLGAATAARIQLRRDVPGAVASVSRRGVNLVPGSTADVGTLVLRGFKDDAPVQFDGAELADSEDGVVFAEVDPHAAVASLGLEDGAALVRVGALEAARLPVADLVDGLAGGAEGFDVDPEDDVLIRDTRGATFSIPLGALMSALGGL